MPISVTKELLLTLHPLMLISTQFHDALLGCCQLKTIEDEKIVIRKPFNKKYSHYLVEGCVEVRTSFEDRLLLSSIEEKASFPLEEQIVSGGAIKTKQVCGFLVFETDVVDRMLSLSQSEDYKIVHLNAGSSVLNDQMMIDDGVDGGAGSGVENDWTKQFFQTQLASHLPSSVLHELFNTLEDIDVKKDQVITEKNSPGDYFYIIKEGDAQILTDSAGPYSGKIIALSVGNFFGDEALVADTVRNATVVMASDGVLGRLDALTFTKIIRNNLVVPFNQELKENLTDFEYIDVRHPIEYKHAHYEGAINVPISHLRKKINDFKTTKAYIITADGGRRSELAVYLLRQAGINSFYMSVHE